MGNIEKLLSYLVEAEETFTQAQAGLKWGVKLDKVKFVDGKKKFWKNADTGETLPFKGYARGAGKEKADKDSGDYKKKLFGGELK